MKTRITLSIILVGAAIALCVGGCANGKWNTGSTATDAALTQAQSVLASQVATVAGKVAQGQDAKTALVQASGDAVRSLEGVAITAVQPVVTERLLKWVPKNPEWQNYAHNVGAIIDNYVHNHANTPGVLQAALEAVAVTLNTY